ncbi:MAG: diguanylate cyclase [Phycisphaerae bacterium]
MGNSSNRRVLIVDDDPAFLRLTQRHLTGAGYEVLTATTGAEAYRVILAEGPKIVLTDWVMPEMDGLQLCRAIREHDETGFVYIIMLTGCSDADSVVQAFEAGADDFIGKSVEKRELLARLRAGERIVRLEHDLAAKTREGHLQNAQLAIANDTLNRMAITDELTGLLNRRAAVQRLREAWASSTRTGQPVAVMAFDIDHFKAINDTHGHDVGDLVLRRVARKLQDTARLGEAVCRMGGEEFLVLCAGSTVEMAARGADRLRRAVEGTEIVFENGRLRATISGGVAERTSAMELPEDVLKVADDALYVAKRNGRNRVEVANPAGGAALSPTLELVADPLPGAQPRSSAPHPVRPSVLVVATLDSVRAICQVQVTRAGYAVVEARTGAEALQQLQTVVPCIIVIDSAMSEFEVVRLVERLAADPRHCDTPLLSFGTLPPAGIVAQHPHIHPDRADDMVLRLRLLVELSRTRRALAAGNSSRGEQVVALEALLDYSNVLTDVADLPSVLERTGRTIAFLTHCQQVAIALPRDEGRTLRIAHAVGLTHNFDRPFIDIAGSPWGRAYLSRERVPIESDDGAADLEAPFASPPSLPALLSPLATSGQPVGALLLAARVGGGPLDAMELGYLDIISQIAASVIHGILTEQARDEARDSIVVALAKLAEYRDDNTAGHVERVTRNCVVLAQALRCQPEYAAIIDEAFIADLRRAVPLHDIGKVGIPDQVLLKPGKLTAAEIQIMRTHCQIGANCLQSVLKRTPDCSFLQMAVDIAASHHEWFNGCGYPHALAGDAIPLAARITALADVYDALRSRRPYKRAMSHTRARTILLSASGTQFDPAVVRAFLDAESIFIAQDIDPVAASPQPERTPAVPAGTAGA